LLVLSVNFLQAPMETIVCPIRTGDFGKNVAVPRGITETALEELPSQDLPLLEVLVEVAMVEVEEGVARKVMP
jgi:hypothetical protein